jgi:ParB family chromosome partitioning protein
MSKDARRRFEMSSRLPPTDTARVVPSGTLRILETEDIKPSPTNPRYLFDPEPLKDLRDSIRMHGVLVPITVYQPKGQSKYSILDGERRYRCCLDLKDEGLDIKLPANVVDPPDKIAGLLYMFSIHNFREAWQLMPTALSLKVVMDEKKETDTKALSEMTGLSEMQIKRCKTLLDLPERFQQLSLDPDPTTRIPANFWIEADPVLDLIGRELPAVMDNLGREGVLDLLVQKYRAGSLKSVIHFRRIMEAYEFQGLELPVPEDQQDDEELTTPARKNAMVERLGEYIQNVDLETRKAFDEFVVESRQIQGAISACDAFLSQLRRLKLDFLVDRAEVVSALKEVGEYIDGVLEKLSGSDAPVVTMLEDEAE